MLPGGGFVAGTIKRAAEDERNRILGETRIGIVNSEEYVMRHVFTPVSDSISTEVPWQKVIRVSTDDYEEWERLGKQFESDLGGVVLGSLALMIATMIVL